MSQFVEVKTADLIGQALDWAVAIAEGWVADRPQDGQIRKNGVYRLVGPHQKRTDLSPDWFYAPSTDWAHGGPMIDTHKIWVSGPILARTDWSAAVDTGLDVSRGPTALIALCRALVHSKLGDVVQVPVELTEVKNDLRTPPLHP